MKPFARYPLDLGRFISRCNDKKYTRDIHQNFFHYETDMVESIRQGFNTITNRRIRLQWSVLDDKIWRGASQGDFRATNLIRLGSTSNRWQPTERGFVIKG